MLTLFHFKKINKYINSHTLTFLTKTVVYCTYFYSLCFVHLTIDSGDHPKHPVAIPPHSYTVLFHMNVAVIQPCLYWLTLVFLQSLTLTDITAKHSFEHTAFQTFASVSLGWTCRRGITGSKGMHMWYCWTAKFPFLSVVSFCTPIINVWEVLFFLQPWHQNMLSHFWIAVYLTGDK